MRRGRFLGSLAAFGCAAAAARSQTLPPQVVELGGDVFLRDHIHELAGKRVGIITNQTGVTSGGREPMVVEPDEEAPDLQTLVARHLDRE